MNDETFRYFAMLLFFPIIMVFQVFIGYMVAKYFTVKETDNEKKMYFIYWLYGLGVSTVIAGVYFIITKLFFGI